MNRTSLAEVVIPVIAEELVTEKLSSETERVRVTTAIESRTVHVDVPRVEERIEVERVAMNTPVDGPIPVREEGDTTIVSVVEEIVVVEKRFVLREEIRLRRLREEQTLSTEVTLRREVAQVERLDPK